MSDKLKGSGQVKGSGPARAIPCLACAKFAATGRGDGVCRDNLAKPNSPRCEHCWATSKPCIPAVAILRPLIRNLTQAIAAGDEEVVEKARRKLRAETLKYHNRVGDKRATRQRSKRKPSGSSKRCVGAPAAEEAKTQGASGGEQSSDKPAGVSKLALHLLNILSVGPAEASSTVEAIGEKAASVSGKISSNVKQELLEIGNEIYYTGTEKFGGAEDGPVKTGDRLKDIGERLVYIASKLEAE